MCCLLAKPAVSRVLDAEEVRNVIIISAGFKEVGPEGERRLGCS